MRQKMLTVATMVVCLAAGGVYGYPYIEWTAAMGSAESSDLGGYPAQNVFDSTYGSLGYRSDWAYAQGTAQGDTGFSLRDDFHGNWHSGATVGGRISPSGTSCQEWIAADFASIQTIYGVDIWNTNWNVINQTRAVKSMSIDVSADGVNWVTVWLGDLSMAPGTRPHLMYDGVDYVNPNLDPGHDPQYGLMATDSILFGNGVDAQYVVLNFHTNWGNDAYMAIEEVRFLAVPEPATLSLLSLGVISFWRKRKN